MSESSESASNSSEGPADPPVVPPPPPSDDLSGPSVPPSKWQSWFSGFLNEQREWPLYLRRSLRSDFYRETATDAERARLAGTVSPIETPLAQDFAAWRRGMLWFTFVAMVIALVFSLIETIDVLTTTNIPGMGKVPGIVKFVQCAFFAIQLSATALVLWAAMRWTDLSPSRKLTRFAWFVLFGGPILLLLVPWASMSSLGERAAAAGLLSAGAAMILVPKILGLFAGLIRASLTLKTLLPESQIPGWLAVFVVPFYILFLFIPLTIAIQLTAGFLLVLALILFLLSPIILATKTRKLLEPISAEQGHRLVRSIRLSNVVCIFAGGICFIIFAIDVMKEISFWDALSIVASFLTSVLLLALVMSDFMLGVMCRSFAQGQSFKGSEAEQRLGEKISDLAAGGMAAIDMGEGAAMKKLGGAAKFAGWVGKELASGADKKEPEASNADDERKDA